LLFLQVFFDLAELLLYSFFINSNMGIAIFNDLILALFNKTNSAVINKVFLPVLFSGTRSTYPLIVNWITEFAEVNQIVDIQLANNSKISYILNSNIIKQHLSEEIIVYQIIIRSGRSVLITVVTCNSPKL